MTCFALDKPNIYTLALGRQFKVQSVQQFKGIIKQSLKSIGQLKHV